MKHFNTLILIVLTGALWTACSTQQTTESMESEKVKVITLDPGHFHAALVQKKMYPDIDSVVHVYAPAGTDVEEHLKRIEGYNTRTQDPTRWKETVYTGNDYLEKMLAEKSGNVVVIAGSNLKKTEYIRKSVDAGLNVLADKPMCIDSSGFNLLKESFEAAEKNNVLLYDIMTERSEITTMLQKELSQLPDIFGHSATGKPGISCRNKRKCSPFFQICFRQTAETTCMVYGCCTAG